MTQRFDPSRQHEKLAAYVTSAALAAQVIKVISGIAFGYYLTLKLVSPVLTPDQAHYVSLFGCALLGFATDKAFIELLVFAIHTPIATFSGAWIAKTKSVRSKDNKFIWLNAWQNTFVGGVKIMLWAGSVICVLGVIQLEKVMIKTVAPDIAASFYGTKAPKATNNNEAETLTKLSSDKSKARTKELADLEKKRKSEKARQLAAFEANVTPTTNKKWASSARAAIRQRIDVEYDAQDEQIKTRYDSQIDTLTKVIAFTTSSGVTAQKALDDAHNEQITSMYDFLYMVGYQINYGLIVLMFLKVCLFFAYPYDRNRDGRIDSYDSRGIGVFDYVARLFGSLATLFNRDTKKAHVTPPNVTSRDASRVTSRDTVTTPSRDMGSYVPNQGQSAVNVGVSGASVSSGASYVTPQQSTAQSVTSQELSVPSRPTVTRPSYEHLAVPPREVPTVEDSFGAMYVLGSSKPDTRPELQTIVCGFEGCQRTFETNNPSRRHCTTCMDKIRQRRHRAMQKD